MQQQEHKCTSKTNTEIIIGIVENSKTTKMKTTMVAFLNHQMKKFRHNAATFRDKFFGHMHGI